MTTYKSRARMALTSAALAVALAGLSSAAFAADAPKPAPAKAGKPRHGAAKESFDPKDFSGVWSQDQGVLFSDPTKGAASGATPAFDESKNPPPFTPKYAAIYAKILEDYRNGKATNDPTADCSAPGMPRMMINPYPIEILHTPNRITILAEYLQQIRRIYMDGRPHPDPDERGPLYYGHAIGHWEGNTLVVDTVQLRGDTPIQSTGLPHSDKLHIVERFRMLNKDKFEDEITLIDTDAYTRPYKSTRTWSRVKNYEINEYYCTNNRSYIDENGVSRIRLQQ